VQTASAGDLASASLSRLRSRSERSAARCRVASGRRPRCRDFTPGVRRATRASATRPICAITSPTRGRPWSAAAVRADLRRTAATADVRPISCDTLTPSKWPRRRATHHDSAPTGPQRSRHHLDLPAKASTTPRSHRDRPRPPSTVGARAHDVCDSDLAGTRALARKAATRVWRLLAVRSDTDFA